MSKIKAKNSKPELILRKALFAAGVRYRLNVTSLPGKPDIVIRKYKIAIFVDGEFWHGFNWHIKKHKIQANKEYWIKKIEGNMQRDIQNNFLLQNQGFKVIRFWEKDIKINLDLCVHQILQSVREASA